MQKLLLILVLLVSGSISVKAQSLKELLYGGKLKMDSNAVLRKTDDLKARIDSGQKKPVDSVKNITANSTTIQNDSARVIVSSVSPDSGIVSSNVNTVVNESALKTPAAPAKTNTKIWKEYSDALANTLKAEVLSNKKIKKESYFVLVAYEIDTTSQVNITNVTTTPTNALLQSEILQRLQNEPPLLSPMLDSAGKPRKTKRTHSFTVVKD